MKQRTSIYTIAKEAGVSTATVSKIINNHGNISKETSARVLELIQKSQTGAILPVHVFGRLCDSEGFAKLAAEKGLKLIYDGAHAFDLPIFGDATTYSFHATKLFHTAEGGAAAFPASAVASPVMSACAWVWAAFALPASVVSRLVTSDVAWV